MSKFLYAVVVLLVLQTSTAFASPPTSLVGYWKLDESQANSASTADAVISNNGTVQGSIEFGVLGVNGVSTAIRVDSSEYIEIPHHDDYLIDNGTISLWIYPESTSSTYGILSKDSTSYDTGGHFTIFQQSDGRIRARLQSNTTNYEIDSTSTVTVGAWTHIAYTFGADGFKLYLDGVLEASHSYTGGLGTTSSGAGNFEPIVIGGGANRSGNLIATPVKNHYRGRIDEVGILSEQWDAVTIQDLFNATGPGTTTTLEDFAGPSTFYVRTRGSDSYDGKSPSTAFRTIQHAIDNCTQAGTTVYVGPGTYTETIEIGTGGGANAVSGIEDYPTQLIADTQGEFTLDSPGAVVIDGLSSQSTAILASGIIDWVIDGFTIQNFTTYGIQASSAGLSVLNCLIEVPGSFAIYATATGDFVVADCEFVRTTDSRHLVWITPLNTTESTSVTITRNDGTFKGELYGSYNLSNGFNYNSYIQNLNFYSYGIIVYAWSTAMIDTIEISNNQLSDFYLPIYCVAYTSNGYESRIQNNTVTESLYTIYTYTQSGGTDYILNNIIDNSYYGLLAYTRNGGTQSISGLMEHAITYDMSRLARPYQSGILTSSPIFTDPQLGDFSLRGRSEAIDAGSTLFALPTDIDGNPRPVDGDEDEIAAIDLGAYEIVTEPIKLRMVQWREIGADAERFVDANDP
ncbi:MAG: LamG-like jellyroll fold domain-containing protein [Phycisphaerales bacterium]